MMNNEVIEPWQRPVEACAVQRAHESLMAPVIAVLEKMLIPGPDGRVILIQETLDRMPLPDLINLAAQSVRALESIAEAGLLAQVNAGDVGLRFTRGDAQATRYAVDLLSDLTNHTRRVG